MGFNWEKVNSYTTTTYTIGEPIEIEAPSWKIGEKITINSPSTESTYTVPMQDVDPNYAQGWVCPKCGRVNAPWVSMCPCSGQFKIVGKTTSGTPSYCMNCANHPNNGGTGICHCILGSTKITC